MGENGECAPATMKVFINRNDIDFDCVDDVEPTQEWNLIQHLARDMVPEYPTKLTKFSNVRNLTIYIPENFGGDVTKIAYIGLKGEYTVINKDPIITHYEIAANPADHKLKGTSINQAGSGVGY